MLAIDGITVRLGGRAILERASATVPVGARVGLIGGNGAGKSTLMKALIGKIEPDDGEISKPARARIGYIAQEAPSGTMSAEEVVLAAVRALITRDAPHLLILVDGGTAREYDGSMDDYIDFILGSNQSRGERGGKARGGRGIDTAGERRRAQSALTKAGAAIAGLTADVEQSDQEILELSSDAGGRTGGLMQGLLTRRAAAVSALAEAEEAWLAAGAALEALQSV